VSARVISIGNLTVGGTGKTTLTLHLALAGRARGHRVAVVCRNYRPPRRGTLGDEARLYRARLGAECVFAGDRKWRAAEAAAAAGCGHVLVDDGFSHWPLERDLDVVLLDARDPWGGGFLLPRGSLREPRRALQRADVVIVTRLAPDEDPAPCLERVRPYAPAARLAAGRHEVVGARALFGAAEVAPPRRVWIVTATGNPEAVATSAREAGFEVAGLSAYRDHHWFSEAEQRREARRAAEASAAPMITAKDSVRWGLRIDGEEGLPLVLEVGWRWRHGGEAVESMVWGGA
jgi:tetraacyldisaccharide 4'-kinase